MNGPRTNHAKRLLVVAIVALFLSPDVTSGGWSATFGQRLISPATVRGLIGGESHDSYTIRVRQGRTMSVRLSWRPQGGNQAWFTVSESPDFFTAQQVGFGRVLNERAWTGQITQTRDYYIYVVAHPVAHYQLEVGVK